MDTNQLNAYVAAAAGVVAGLVAIGHALEGVVGASNPAHPVLAKIVGVLDAISGFLPKIRF